MTTCRGSVLVGGGRRWWRWLPAGRPTGPGRCGTGWTPARPRTSARTIGCTWPPRRPGGAGGRGHTHTPYTHTHTTYTQHTYTYTQRTHNIHIHTHNIHIHTHTQQHTTCVGCGRWEGGQPFACDSAASSQPFVGVLLLLHRSLSVWLRCPTTVVSYVLCSGCRLPAPHSRKK